MAPVPAGGRPARDASAGRRVTAGASSASPARHEMASMALIARARHHFIYADVKAAQEKAAKARELVARNGTAREKSHAQEPLALGRMEGQSAKSLSPRARASR